MTRDKFYKEISGRTGIPKDIVSQVIQEEENLVYEIMATCDSIKYIWGTISGVEKPPKRIGGMYREIDAIKKNYGWSNWKIGYPEIKWSKVSKVCDIRHPREYFELQENRYTSLARSFRKDGGLEEIPEYQGLNEEKIQEICKKADEVQFNQLTYAQKHNKKRDEKFNAIKKLAMIDYWNKTGYTPQGVVYNEILGENNYSGKQRDTIDFFLTTKLDQASTLPDKLEVIRQAIDIAEYRNLLEKHPELFEKEKEYIEKVKNKGLQEIPHKKREFKEKLFSLKYGEEVDPWGFRSAQKARQEKEEKIKKSQEDLENLLQQRVD